MGSNLIGHKPCFAMLRRSRKHINHKKNHFAPSLSRRRPARRRRMCHLALARSNPSFLRSLRSFAAIIPHPCLSVPSVVSPFFGFGSYNFSLQITSRGSGLSPTSTHRVWRTSRYMRRDPTTVYSPGRNSRFNWWVGSKFPTW